MDDSTVGATETLERRLAEALRAKAALEQSLADAQAVARSAEEELRLFAYAASHDLQEPLRSISSYAQLLERQYAGNPDAAELTAFIVDAVNRMTTLIRDLLTYSRLARPQRRTVSLGSLVQWALMNLEAPIREAKAQILQADLPDIQVDESQIVQLLQHLLSNALRYRSAAPPEIEITAAEDEDACIVSVRDNGVGIEPRFHEQVFGIFKRLHGREVPGTGMGLALCRKIVEGHGGRIWVESSGTSGSVFKFSLPF